MADGRGCPDRDGARHRPLAKAATELEWAAAARARVGRTAPPVSSDRRTAESHRNGAGDMADELLRARCPGARPRQPWLVAARCRRRAAPDRLRTPHSA